MTTTESRDFPTTVVDRAELPKLVAKPSAAKGLLLVDPAGATAFPLASAERDEAARLASETLISAGIKSSDRVVVALNNDGDLTGALIARAVADIAEAAASTGPRGRMRTLRVLEAVRANVLISTPSGAADFLARMHMEFLVDPLDLELRLLILTGEIADAKTVAHLAKEFGATVVELFLDPISGIPVAHRQPAKETELTVVREGELGLVDSEVTAADGSALSEIAVHHSWHPALTHTAVRTGYLTAPGDTISAPVHTTGDRILVRGGWLSITALTKALRAIDGISQWTFRVTHEGTLDVATLSVSFNRASLVANGMWKSRIAQSLTALTPVRIDVEVDPTVREETAEPRILDVRGHHIY
ncbi:hypothetical protein [Rhodococcus sp. 077-4]|uniref:hypothetical protein n=1 Tax=Rhodococcus sp. 077-4 TaxID=2789271 RepID=UPI0039F52A39